MDNQHLGVVTTDSIDDLQHTAIYELLRERREELNYELRAAWRMGYNYAHVYERVVDFEFETHVFPCDVANPPEASDDLRYKETYVLDDERILTAKERVQ